MLQAHSTSSPAACGEAPGGAGCPPAAHGSPMEQISTLQPPHGWRSPRWSRWMWPGGGCGPWRAPAGAGPGPELQPVERSPRGAGAERDREGVVEMKCYRLTTTPSPVPLFPCAARGEELEELRWGEGRCFWFLSFGSHLSSLVVVVVRQEIFLCPYAESALPIMILVERSPCPCLNP